MCATTLARFNPNPRTQLALLLALTLLTWLPTLRTTDWTADDPQVVLANPVVTAVLPARAAFTRDYTQHLGPSGQWRPAATLSLRLDHALHGPDSSRGWHLTNLLLHLATLGLAALLALRVQGKLLLLGLAAFALHPLLADSIAWTSGRPALLCALLGLTGAHLLQTSLSTTQRTLPTLACATLALCLPLLAKEDGILFALLLLALAARASRAALRDTLVGCTIATALWLAVRAAALGHALPTAAHPFLGDSPLYERLAIGVRAAAETARLSITPIELPPHYELTTLPELPLALLLLSVVATILYLLHKRHPIPLTALLLPTLAFIPFLHILPAGEVFAPRFAHIPLLFAIPLADHLLRRLPTYLPPLLLLPLLPLTYAAIPTYADAESYWLKTLHHTPSSHVAWNALGLARADQRRHTEAIASYRTAIQLNPKHSRTYSNLARSLQFIGKEEEAIAALQSAVTTGPNNPIAHTNWARHLARSDRHAEAREHFLRATRLQPESHHAWAGLARAEAALGYPAAAAAASERARALAPR